MPIRRWTKCLFALSVLLNLAAAAPEAATPLQTRHALLIGCTVYPNLARRYQLRGPANDVKLTAELLRERFGYGDGDIVTLIHENDESLRPTAENIIREFEALIERAGPGDSVFILLGGHGSQQKDDNPGDPADGEDDGLDEVFLPEDVTEWKYKKDVVKAIRDDQIGAWLDAIRAKGANVFFVADTCHSGTMARGGPDEDDFYRERAVEPSVINSPEDLVAAKAVMTSRANQDGGEAASRAGVADSLTVPAGDVGGLVALYAVDDRSKEREHPMPPDGTRDSPSFGRLSYALNWVLTRARNSLTYRELAQQISWQYAAWQWDKIGFMSCTPDELKRQVLGEKLWRDRSTVTLYRDDIGRLSINVGLLHGATVGSVYLVYPPTGAERDDQAAGAVRVVEATPSTARVESVAYGDVNDAAPAETLPAPGRCELAYAAAGAMKMSVSVEAVDPAMAAGVPAVEQIVRDLAEMRGMLVRLAASEEIADAVILVGKKGLYLRRTFEAADGVVEADQDAAAEDVAAAIPPDADQPVPGDEAARFPEDAFGPFPIESGRDSSLARALTRMAKALNIRRLATCENSMMIGDPYDPAVMLEIKVELYDPETKQYKEIDPTVPLDVTDGDEVRVSVANTSGSEVDVTILYVDSAFGIRSYYPTRNAVRAGRAHNRLIPGGAPAVVPFKVTDSTVGLEDVIIIATLPAKDAPLQNFVFLEQHSLSRSRGEAAPDSPLAQLLSLAAFGVGDRGSGNAAPDIAKYAVHRVSWTVHRRPAPEM